jgi:hypothetical protein
VFVGSPGSQELVMSEESCHPQNHMC